MIELSYNFLHWFKRHHFLYLFGFLVYFRPIDSFYHEMLVTTKNITDSEYQETFHPLSTYSAVIVSFLIFLCINFCFYNHFLIFTCIGGLVFSTASWQAVATDELQVAEVFNGCTVAAEIIYFASIYVCHDLKKNFPSMTASIRAVPLLAQLIAAIVSQVVVTNGWLNYKELTFLSVPACVHSILVITHLPPMFELQETPTTFILKLSWLKKKVKETFSNPQVIRWSLWIGFTMSGYYQMSFTMQSIWRKAQLENDEAPYNGAVDGISSFLSLLGVLLSATLKPNLKHQNIFLCVTSTLQAAMLFGFGFTRNAWDRTIIYIVLNMVYHFVMTTITAILAKNVNSKSSTGIVFSFIGLIYSVSNLIFACVINNNGIKLTQPEQFSVYGGYHLAIACLVGYVYVINFWCGH